MQTSRSTSRWIVCWEDPSGDSDHDFRASADSASEVETTIRRFLEGFTWTPEDAEEIGGDRTVSAIEALAREQFAGNVANGLEGMPQGEAIEFECDDGKLLVTRER